MLYNTYSPFHFANPDNYTTFAGVNSMDMKKIMVIMALCAMAFSFTSCSSEAENDLAGHRFEHRYNDENVDYYEFSLNGNKVKVGATYNEWEVEFTYVYKNKIIYMYKHGVLHPFAEYYGDYIIVNDGLDSIFIKVW